MSARIPPATVLQAAAKIAVQDDRPILLDYYEDSLDKKCCVGVKDDVKHLVKSDSEYTSTIQTISRIDGCFIVLTENSLYIVSAEVPVKKIVSKLE